MLVYQVDFTAYTGFEHDQEGSFVFFADNDEDALEAMEREMKLTFKTVDEVTLNRVEKNDLCDVFTGKPTVFNGTLVKLNKWKRINSVFQVQDGES